MHDYVLLMPLALGPESFSIPSVFEDYVKFSSQIQFSSLDCVVWILLACQPLEAGGAGVGSIKS